MTDDSASTAALWQRLLEAEATLEAIRAGRVDAVVVDSGQGDQLIYTLESADLPYRYFLEHMGEGALSLDGDATVLFCNRFFAELVGQPRERVLGASFTGFLTEQANEAFRPALASERPQRLGVELRLEDGRTLPVQLALTSSGSGSGRRINVVVSDLSERERVRELRAAREAAEAESLAKDNFLAAAGHDLRTPLNVVIGWTALLLQRKDSFDPGTRKALETIARNAQMQSKLIDDILDISRIASGKLRIERSPLDLGELARGVVAGLELAAQAKGIELTIEAEERVPVLGDAQRLEQVLQNLIGNALKFTPRGGHVRVYSERVGARARLRVRDDGRGIEPSALPRMFQLFRQGAPARTRESGLGLGLTITKHLVELHEGAVSAASAGLGLGSEFTVELPLDESAKLPVAVASAPAAAEPVTLHGLRVLVVDDEEDTRELTARALRGGGAEVVSVTDAAAALARIEREQFDVIISDLMMPGTSGFELAREIRARHGASRPLLALSSLSSDEDKARALEAGYAVFISKPAAPEMLCRAVLSVWGARSAAHSDAHG